MRELVSTANFSGEHADTSLLFCTWTSVPPYFFQASTSCHYASYKFSYALSLFLRLTFLLPFLFFLLLFPTAYVSCGQNAHRCLWHTIDLAASLGLGSYCTFDSLALAMFQRTILNPPSRGTAQWTISGRQPPTMPWSYSFHSSMVAPGSAGPQIRFPFITQHHWLSPAARDDPSLRRSHCHVCALTDWATRRYQDQTYFRTIPRGLVGSNLAAPKPLFL